MSGALLLGGAACDSNDFNAVVILASNITVNAGSDNQIGTVNLPLPNPIVVHVTDRNGNGLPNSIVIFTVLSGGGSVSTNASTTDANGNASVIWTMGPAVGSETLSASVAGGPSVTITANAQAAVAITATILKTSGDAQTITAGTTSAPMVVLIQDLAGNPIANATVTWATSGGTLSATTTTTDATGHTQVTLATAATPAVDIVTVSSPGATSVTFTISAITP